ncbi:MAG: ABC transporter permease [Planctomycetales bacterium]|nr:ABC transporter permease [Planctomycetales bacterium]
MNTLTVVRKNLRQRLLSSVLTAGLVAVGVALVDTIWVLRAEAEKAFFKGTVGNFNLLVGPKGSPLQLVLNSLFHLDRPVGNLPYAAFESLAATPIVEWAVPLAVGDNYLGHAIVGTSPAFFDRLRPAADPFAFAEGRAFEGEMEAVLGSEAARRTRLRPGATFLAAHGVVKNPLPGSEHEAHPLRVVGILAPTGTPHDRAIYCTVETVWRLHELGEHHDEAAGSPGGAAPDDDRVVSAVLVRLRSPTMIGEIQRQVNDKPYAQAVHPTVEINNLFAIVGNIDRVLLAVSYIVLVSAGVSILVALYNSMSERRREVAILRALGAPARTIFLLVLAEAAALTAAGGVAGIGLRYGALAGASPWMREWAGVAVSFSPPGPAEVLLLAGTIGLGALAALLPAAVAYRTDVSRNLHPLT